LTTVPVGCRPLQLSRRSGASPSPAGRGRKGGKEAAHFRASKFPSSLLHVEADLKGEKPFQEAVTRTNVAGACGLALVRCGELVFSSLGKGSELMIRLSDAFSGESSLGAGYLLQLLRGTKEDLMDREGLGDIADVGAEIATGSYNQGVD
jgi:hypothetical protein